MIFSGTINAVESCVAEVNMWMESNMLKLNQSKTEVMLFSSTHGSVELDQFKVCLGNDVISPSTSVRNLGVVWDRHLTMQLRQVL